MNRLAIAVVLAAVTSAGGEVRDMTEKLHWLGHDAFRIDGPPTVYIDPYQLGEGLPSADIVLITHDHFDHLSLPDLAKVMAKGTVVVGPKEVAAKVKQPVRTIAPGETLTVKGVKIRAVPAYNTNKSFHPKSDGKVGFVLTLGGVTYYHAGDTDVIPEMAGLAPDVALLPVSGTYVMTADEAAEAARSIRPKVAVPMHYGAIVGTDGDARRFAKLLEGSGIEVVVKRKE
ncbi:MAG TPA: MBL fold metallo-hydrolase [Thermoanaerobaculaceae bacterium]|nr:MBL fold metallo-hydrolase [Thermoanaerobaculaceae bacterium]